MKLKRLPFFCKSMLAALCLLGAGMTFTSCDDDSEDLTQVDTVSLSVSEKGR